MKELDDKTHSYRSKKEKRVRRKRKLIKKYQKVTKSHTVETK